MSFQSLADVFAYVQAHDDLTTNDVVVLTAIAHHADRNGANAYPTLEALGTCTKLQRRATQYALRRLEARDALKTTLTRGKPGKQTYQLLLPHVPLSRGAPHAPLNAQEVHHMHLIPSQEVHVVHPDPGKSKKGENSAHARDNGRARGLDRLARQGQTDEHLHRLAALAPDDHATGHGERLTYWRLSDPSSMPDCTDDKKGGMICL